MDINAFLRRFIDRAVSMNYNMLVEYPQHEKQKKGRVCVRDRKKQSSNSFGHRHPIHSAILVLLTLDDGIRRDDRCHQSGLSALYAGVLCDYVRRAASVRCRVLAVLRASRTKTVRMVGSGVDASDSGVCRWIAVARRFGGNPAYPLSEKVAVSLDTATFCDYLRFCLRGSRTEKRVIPSRL